MNPEEMTLEQKRQVLYDWISVKEKLPNFNVELTDWVIVTDGKKVGWAFYSRCNNQERWCSNGFNVDNITYWQPFPKAPTLKLNPITSHNKTICVNSD